MNHRTLWRLSRDRLAAAVTALGFSAGLAELMARQLGSPKAIDRMTAYVNQARPDSEEMLVDEMLAVCAEIAAWKEKKAGEEAQMTINDMLYYGLTENETDEDIDEYGPVND